MPDLSIRETQYYSGQGELFIGPVGGYDPDDEVGFRWLGNVSALSLTPAEEASEHKESWSGLRSIDRRNVTERRLEVAVTLEDFSPDNLALMVAGERVEDAEGAVAAESIGDAPIDQMIPLAHQGVSSVVITDSTPVTPKTLPAAQYVVDAQHGAIMITDKTTGGAYVAPFKVAYDYETRIAIPFFTVPSGSRVFLRFHGLNTAEVSEEEPLPVLVELYSVEIIPGQSIPLIGDEIAGFELQAQARLDTTRESNATLGQFGRVVVTEPPEEVVGV